MKTLNKIAKIIKSNDDIFGCSDDLKALFGEKNVDYVMLDMPIPFHIKIKSEGKDIIIANKSVIEGADLIVGEMAIGYHGE